MASPHPDPRSAWKPKPLSALRRTSSLLKSINLTTPPNRTAPQPVNEPLHQISIRYSTIAARALSFQEQVLTGITPLRLTQNSLYYQLHPGFSPTTYCFTYQSATPLNTFQQASIQGVRQLHKVNYIWQIICYDLKPEFELPGTLSHLSNPSPPPRQPTPNLNLSSDTQLQETTTSGSHTHSPNQSSPTVDSSTVLDRVSQLPQPAYPPQPPQSTSTVTPSLRRQPTYTSILQQPTTPKPQLKPTSHQSVHRPKPTLTIEDLHRRFHNKPSPFELEKRKKKRSKTTSAAQSLSKFLNSALPAFSRYLAEMQPKLDTCYPSHSQFNYSRAMRTA
ncbi:hypothetical protein N7456_003539 [Penicillium angulare]|uniref:Uncharacterized protein n=1 Tax=Penicillium angulare TaxID=116970 RepID=A0A9W9FV02_9EURO|nr:hypothetical protein N7456_003539 [Penicillium angulare]